MSFISGALALLRTLRLNRGLAFLLILALAGIPSAAGLEGNTTGTADTGNLTQVTPAGTTPAPAGGSVSFETHPPGAIITVDGTELGTSPLTYFFAETGGKDVLIRRKGYENYSGSVSVEPGRRIMFSADLVPLPQQTFDEDKEMPVTAVATKTTTRRSTIPVPTTWPTTPEAAFDPAAAIASAAAAAVILATRRR